MAGYDHSMQTIRKALPFQHPYAHQKIYFCAFHICIIRGAHLLGSARL